MIISTINHRIQPLFWGNWTLSTGGPILSKDFPCFQIRTQKDAGTVPLSWCEPAGTSWPILLQIYNPSEGSYKPTYMLHIVWTCLNFESTRIRFSARSALLKAEKILVRSFLSGQEIMKIILNPCKSKKIKRLFAFFYAHWGWEWSLVLDETRWFGLERLESQHGYLGLVILDGT